MRITTLLKKLLGIQHLLVTGFALEEGALVIEVRPSWRAPRCSGCKTRRGHYDTRPPRRWRHLDFGGVRVYVRYGLRRVSCRVCGVVAEAVPWCDNTTARFTTPFEEAVGFLVQRCDQTSVQEMFRVAWVTVGRIVARVRQRHRPDDPLDGLMAIGIDELSYRKGHQYVTTVTDQLSGRIVWAADGKNAATLTSFFAELGEARCAAIAVVTMDMSEAYITVVTQQVPQAQIVFDRFHVQQLVNEALDETRREEWRRLREVDETQAKTVKGLRWSLLKNGSPKVHVGPELAEGAPGGPVTGAFPGFSLGVLVMGQGPVEARGKRAVFSKARWARLCVRGAGSFHRACPFVTSGPRVDLLHLPRVQLVKSRCPYDLRCTCVIFQPERWGPNSRTLAPLRVRAHRGDHAL